MNSFILPRIRAAYSDLYPCGTVISKQIHTQIDEDSDLDRIYLRHDETEEQKYLFGRWSKELCEEGTDEKVTTLLEQYRILWNSRSYGPHFFDLHGREFQNFSLHLTNRMEKPRWRQLSLSKNHADRRILRSRVYAIGSREDIDWDGKFLNSEEDRRRKKREMLHHLTSLHLFDWFAPHTRPPSIALGMEHDLKIEIKRQGTQETVQELDLAMGNEKKLIAWLNFAASHNVCGSYSVAFGGSQEEEVATNCDGAALLGTMGNFVDTGLKAWLRGRWVAYKKGMHVPPGGNYWALTKFVTGPSHIDCAMIATAFTDLRPYKPIFVPYSERSYFYSLFGHLHNPEELEKRLMIDIEGVLKTCLENQVHTLVTGATGCGAFRHDPFVEAKLWKKCLEKPEYRCGSLQHVVFSILDRENSKNWIAFRNEFSTAQDIQTCMEENT